MATAVRHPSAPAAAQAPARPRRAPGVELLGRFEDSGFKEPPYLARRADGQMVQLSPLLHELAAAIDGSRDETEIAAEVSARVGRDLTPGDARFLIERKLRPLGLLAGDGAHEKRDAPLALRHRKPLVGAGRVRGVARAFQPLFHAPVVGIVLAALLALDVWLFFDHGVAGPLRSALYQPVLLLGVFAAMIAATAFHEIGHAAACRFSGARPGAIGAGFYLVWPAFYCDVTDAYRLPRRGRLRTDLGGVYFNAIFSLACAGAYFATGVEALLLIVVAQHFVVAQQLLPLLRFDGYYVLTDLTGVPDILSRVRPILRGLLPWREREPAAEELKPWARRATALYLLLVVPLVAGLVAWVILGAPRLFATIFDSLTGHAREASVAARAGDWAAGLLAGLESLALLLPCVAISMTLTRLVKLAVGLVRRWTGGDRRRQAIALAGTVAAAALLTASWWPDGDYTPLRQGERMTVGKVFSSPLQTAPQQAGYAAPAPQAAAVGVSPGEQRERIAPLREQIADERETTAPGGEQPAEQPATEPSGTAEPSATPSGEPSPTAEGEPAPEPTATPIEQPGAGDPDNVARAVNTVDGASLFELAFAIQRVAGGQPIEHTNLAQAIASCTACRTIAIAVQVVVVMGGSQLAAPVNVAESLNEVCTSCQTLALAWQLIVTTDGEVEFTQEALRRIREIEAALADLENSDAPVEEVRAAAMELFDDLRETVLTGMVGTADDPPAAGTDETTEAEQAEATPTPTPTPEAEQTAEPEPTPTAEPEGTAEPEPTPTAEPEPTESEPEPTPTAESP